MFILERKQLYIVREPQTKNRTCQSYRWKQYAMCEAREPLEELARTKAHPDQWRVSETAYGSAMPVYC